MIILDFIQFLIHQSKEIKYLKLDKEKLEQEILMLKKRNEVYAYCSNYLKHNFSLGNIYTQSFEEIWNSENAKKLRYSVSKGNFGIVIVDVNGLILKIKIQV